jgi:sugar lactone lactonase YvrE
MDRLAATVAVSAALFIAACGEPLVITGDSPGVMRIVAGIPEQSGDSLGDKGTETLLDAPQGLAAGPDGNLFIADGKNSRIVRVRPTGVAAVLLDHSAQLDEPRLHAPAGLAHSGDNRLFIADSVGGRVWRLTLPGKIASPVAGTGDAGSTDTTVALQTQLRVPTGVAVDSDGAVFVSERNGHRVRRIDTDGSIATIAGTGTPGFFGDGGPATGAQLNEPTGLALGGDILYIADTGNHRIRAVDLSSGTIETIAGSGNAGFGGDGRSALEALLNEPSTVSVTADRLTLFIADVANNRVRMVQFSTGNIFTFAGTGDDAFEGDLLSAAETGLDAPRSVIVTPFNLFFVSDAGHHIVYRTALGSLPTP